MESARDWQAPGSAGASKPFGGHFFSMAGEPYTARGNTLAMRPVFAGRSNAYGGTPAWGRMVADPRRAAPFFAKGHMPIATAGFNNYSMKLFHRENRLRYCWQPPGTLQRQQQ